MVGEMARVVQSTRCGPTPTTSQQTQEKKKTRSSAEEGRRRWALERDGKLGDFGS